MSEKKNDNQVVGILTDSNQLDLTLEQEQAIKLWDTTSYKEGIAAAVGVSPEVLQDWQKQTIFRLALRKYGAEMNELQAVVLTLDNVSFADAEKTLELDPGTITEWAKDVDSPFAELLEEFRMESREEKRDQVTYENSAKQETEEQALKDQQMLAIPHIVAGKSDAQVAEAVGVARETVNRWRNHDQDFRNELTQSRRAQINARISALSSVNTKAIEVMEELLDSKDEGTRMRAAMHLLKTVPLTHKNQ